MANFSEIQQYVKQAEGGYTDNPKDAGNWSLGKINQGVLVGTNHGISAPMMIQYLKDKGYARPTDEQLKIQMKSMPYEKAVEIFKMYFWTPILGDSIKDSKIAHIIYDGGVNMGITFIKKLVADTLGTKTYDVTVINAAEPETLFNQIKSKREKRYRELAERPNNAGFLKGWLNRINSFNYRGIAETAIKTVKENKGKVAIIFTVIGLFFLGLYLFNRKK